MNIYYSPSPSTGNYDGCLEIELLIYNIILTFNSITPAYYWLFQFYIRLFLSSFLPTHYNYEI